MSASRPTRGGVVSRRGDPFLTCIRLNRPHVGGILADAKAAYKSIPIKFSQRRFSVVAAFNPTDGRYHTFIGSKMLFGNMRSVTGGVRSAQLLLSIQRRLLRLPADIYLDDLHRLVHRELNERDETATAEVWKTIGVAAKEHKTLASKDEGRVDILPLLGLDLALAARPQLRISEERKDPTLRRIKEIILGLALTPTQAA